MPYKRIRKIVFPLQLINENIISSTQSKRHLLVKGLRKIIIKIIRIYFLKISINPSSRPRCHWHTRSSYYKLLFSNAFRLTNLPSKFP